MFQSWPDLSPGLPPRLLVQPGLWPPEDPSPPPGLQPRPGGGGGAQSGGEAGLCVDDQPPGMWSAGASGQGRLGLLQRERGRDDTPPER